VQSGRPAGRSAPADHSRLNPKFFQLYDGMMEALRDKGIVAHIMLKVYNKKVTWPPAGSKDEERYFRYVVARYQAFGNLVSGLSERFFQGVSRCLKLPMNHGVDPFVTREWIWIVVCIPSQASWNGQEQRVQITLSCGLGQSRKEKVLRLRQQFDIVSLR